MKKLPCSVGVVLLLAGVLTAQVGAPFPTPKLEGLAQTDARSWKELATGRLVLLEFFAHW